MSYVGYCSVSNRYIFTNTITTIEVKANSLPQAIERARQHYFGMS